MNFSIRAKLIGSFTIFLLLLLGVSLLMTNKLYETNDRLGNIVDVSSQKVIVSNEILIDMLEAARHEKNIILETDLARRDYYRSSLNTAIINVDKKLPILDELVDNAGQEYLDDFKQIWAGYKKNLNEIVSLSYRGEKDKAFMISSDEAYTARNESITLLNQLVSKNKANMERDKHTSDDDYDSSVNMIILFVSISIVLAIFMAYTIVISITKRIKQITLEADKIASREYEGSVNGTSINDELKPIIQSLQSINQSFSEVTKHAQQVSSGNYQYNITPKSEKDILGNALHKMTKSLRETTAANEKHNWLATGLNQLSEEIRGDKEIETLAADTLAFLCRYTNAALGAFYLAEDNILRFSAGYAFTVQDNGEDGLAFNEGVLGQVAVSQESMYLEGINREDVVLRSSFIEHKPANIIIVPLVADGITLGVIELGSLDAFTDAQKEFISATLESIAIGINSAIARRKIQMLLEETQVQSEELQSQQEELRQMNEELEEQTQSLKQQQEELQITNEELEEQTQALEMKNKEMEQAKNDIEQKNIQIEASSKYKSEFLANMSHELRTPLNSLLILSKDLSENKGKNLTVDQVESAEIIYNSGYDLLNLINEVLDLSKIEAGKMSVNTERVNLKELAETTFKNFRHHAEQKKLGFKVEFGENLPEYIVTDRQRLDQIIKNIVANAIKFTDKGGITLTISQHTNNTVAIAVKDTGIGIPYDKQASIFEAFQQADGGTSRKYGGTGLGLSISRELVRLLGAELKLESKVNEGSTFTLVIPEAFSAGQESTAHIPAYNPSHGTYKGAEEFYKIPSIPDDRETITQEDKTVLIIEDDQKFATVLLKQAHQKNFKVITAATGEMGLLLAETYKPHAIIMDMNLPGINGDKVLSELKHNIALRHIPVHIISGDDRSLDMIKSGALEYFTKPVEKKQLEEAFNRIEDFIARKMKNLLIVESNEQSRQSMCRLIGNGDVKCFEAQTGHDALRLYSDNHIDCIVLDLDLSDMTGFELIDMMQKEKPGSMSPVIVYTDRTLTREENDELQRCTESIIIKGAKSEERLLDETALFLHRAISDLPESKQQAIANIQDKDALFKGKKILLADDDMRNVFALSKVLKERGLEILKAENGKSALNVLDKTLTVDLVLMDIMMPEMDGYEAMKAIRQQSKYRNLPIIALTAKAMKEDRQKCIDAGANDYITKPVDVDRLLSLIRVWLSK